MYKTHLLLSFTSLRPWWLLLRWLVPTLFVSPIFVIYVPLLQSPLYLCFLGFWELIITIESIKIQGFVIRSETFDNISDNTTSAAAPRGMLEKFTGQATRCQVERLKAPQTRNRRQT